MNNILCVDTTSEFCSVSLFNGNELVNTVNSKIERSHSKLIISLVEKVIKESKIEISDIDAFSISRGPGSYTGLRIGLSCLKGFCYGLDKPLISLNTLKILAKSATEKIDNKENLLLLGMNTDVVIEILNKDVSMSAPSMSLRTRKDVYSAANILNIPKEEVDIFLKNKVKGENFNKFIVIKDNNKSKFFFIVSIVII